MTQDSAQTEAETPYKNPNRLQKTKLRLVDVIGNSLTTTPTQLHANVMMMKLKAQVNFITHTNT